MVRLRSLLISACLLGALSVVPAVAADGADGPTVNVAGGNSIPSGGYGSDTSDATPAGNGGDGGTVNVDFDGSVPGDIVVANGGGKGGDSTSTGAAGNGGDGGTVNITIHVALTGDIVTASGGGYGGSPGGSGGDGGTVNIQVQAPVSGSIVVATGGGAGDGSGSRGGGGVINLTVSSIVGEHPDDQIALATTGHANVRLSDGAVLSGEIVVSANTANLYLSMSVQDQAELAALATYLSDPSHAQNGSVTINGHLYSWTGFTDLMNELTLAQRIAAAAGNSAVRSGRTYLQCKSRKVIAYLEGSSVVFNAKNPDGGKYFHVGDLKGTAFDSANPIGWTVSAEVTKHKLVARVLDAAGKLVATCKL